MKVIAKPIEVVTWTDKDGNIHPIRFRYVQPDESYRTIKVDKVLYKEYEKLAGNPMWKFTCQSIIGTTQRTFELKYALNTCKWMLFKI